jgi:hypothetical protein
VISISPIEASSAADPNVIPPHLVGVDPLDVDEDKIEVDPTNDANVDRPVVPDESGLTDEEKDFWEWFTGKLNGIKDWFGELTGGEKDVENEAETGDER